MPQGGALPHGELTKTISINPETETERRGESPFAVFYKLELSALVSLNFETANIRNVRASSSEGSRPDRA